MTESCSPMAGDQTIQNQAALGSDNGNEVMDRLS